MSLTVIDLYSGCGGMAIGFDLAGFNIVASFDNWDSAIKIHKKNKHILRHPIIDIDLSEVPDDLSIFKRYEPDMIIGGPPCQDFSSAGKRDETLGRADLTIIFSQIVSIIKPSWFVMENVRRTIKSNAYKIAYDIFERSGYGLTETILDSSYYGVPQKRNRLFLIGELGGKDNVLLPYLEKNKSKTRLTMEEYFKESLDINFYYRHPRSYQRRGVFSMKEPSPTVRGVNRPVPPNYKLHHNDRCSKEDLDELRALTTKQRSRVQTFPEDFVLIGTKTDLEQMIGNAVPVNLAKSVGACILEYIEHGTIPQPNQLNLL